MTQLKLPSLDEGNLVFLAMVSKDLITRVPDRSWLTLRKPPRDQPGWSIQFTHFPR